MKTAEQLTSDFQNRIKKSDIDYDNEKPFFFAQYYGQRVLNFGGTGLVEVGSGTISHPQFFLELKSLDDITDEHLNEINTCFVNIIGLDGIIQKNSNAVIKELISNYSKVDMLSTLPTSFADNVRKLGYALDWHDIKISKQIKLGWIKIVNS